MELTTQNLKIVFDGQYNNFTEIRNLATGENYIKCLPNEPLIELFTLQGQEKRKASPETPEISQTQDGLLLHYEKFSNLSIKMDVSLRAERDRIYICAELKNESDTDIVEIRMPCLSGLYLGGTTGQDNLIYPHHAGEKTADPVKNYGVNRKTFWRAGSVPCEDFYRREINYCGLASMSWMYYYNQENGLYIGSHDPRFPVTGVIADTSGNPERPWMGFSFRKHHRIKPGQNYHTGEYVIAVTEQDWHYGAQIYRHYIEPYLDFDHTPQFLKKEYALNQCYNFKRTGHIEHTFRDIPDMYEAGAQWGVRHMFIASWNRTGFDSFYPEYYPDMELGTAMELNRNLQYVRDRGGFSTMYINARIFDVKSDFHSSVGMKMALRNEKGEPYYEEYGPERFTVNCPSDQLWRDYLIDTAEFCMKAYGCDGIYLDQLASAEPFACYAPDHSHEDIGDFNNGYLYILRELLGRLRKINPNAYLMTENCGDIYGSYTWGNLTWNGAYYDEYYNVFRYTFPEFVQVNMVNPRSWEDDPDKKQEWYHKDMHRAITLGNIMWIGITTRMGTPDSPIARFARQELSFRKNLVPLLDGAEFLDDAWLSSLRNDNCKVTCWHLADGNGMILAANDGTTKENLQFDLPMDADHVEVISDDGSQILCAHSKQKLQLVLEPDQLVRVLVHK